MPSATIDAKGRATRALFALASLGLFLFARPARADVVRLEDLERHALALRTSMVGRARIDAARARIGIARAPLYPVLTASAELGVAPGGRLVHVDDVNGEEYLVQGSRSFGDTGALRPETHYGVTAQLGSRLLDFGRTNAAVRAAEAGVGAAEASAHADRADVVLAVRARYLAWLLAAGQRDILRQNAADAAAARQSVEGRVAEGARPPADVSAARYDEARAALELAKSEAELTSSRLALEQTVGGELQPGAEPETALLDVRAGAEDSGEAPQVRALERQRDAALATARAHGKARAPVLSAVAEAGVRGQTGELFPLYRVGLNLSMSVLDGGLESSSNDLARAEAAELSALAREARDRVLFDRSRAHSDLETADTRLRLAQALASAAEAALRHAEDQRELGAAPLEVLFQARSRNAQAKLELLAARVARAEVALRLSPAESPSPAKK